MQVLIALPELSEIEARGGIKKFLLRKVSGVPLLTRVIATAGRGGALSAIIIHPKSITENDLWPALASAALEPISTKLVAADKAFDPENAADWQSIESQLEDKFVWLPWDLAIDRYSLGALVKAGAASENGARFAHPDEQAAETNLPLVVVKSSLRINEGDGMLSRFAARPDLQEVGAPYSAGIRIQSNETRRAAEWHLVQRSGKATDGVFSTFNRRLCWPLVRGLAKTPITPNVISFVGLFVAILSGYWYAQGYWGAYALGGLFYFISVLFDEMDGMLARIKFKESAFGCWLETVIDYSSYIIIFVAMTIGLYRQSGTLWLILGGVLIFSTTIALFVFSYQRKIATTSKNPNEYLLIYHRRLEEDSGNLLSRLVRQTEFVLRKAPMSHFLLIFSALGALKVLFLLAVLSAGLAAPIAISMTRLFKSSPEENHTEEGYLAP